MPDLALTPLDDLTVVDARGADAVSFLQGQLSHDLALLAGRGGLLAGLHNPQGRVIALLRLLQLAGDHLLIVLPASLAAPVRVLLGKYVLRSKVALTDAGTTWRVYGVGGPDAGAAASTRLHMPVDPAGNRQIIIAPRAEPLPEAEPAERLAWRLDDIADGIPEITPALSGAFVAQMLNLDLLDAISFSKGCYTGQEVIARAHYRGQVKRRMQRFFTATEAPLAPGERVRLTDGRGMQVVMAAPAEAGGQELLAVGPMTATGAPGDEDGSIVLDAAPLPLPYALPA